MACSYKLETGNMFLILIGIEAAEPIFWKAEQNHTYQSLPPHTFTERANGLLHS